MTTYATEKARVAEIAAERYPSREYAIAQGWRLSGPGPARFGWWLIYPAGAATYLGRTMADVEATIREEATP